MIITREAEPVLYAEQMSFQAAFMLIIAASTTDVSARESLFDAARSLAREAREVRPRCRA